MLQFIIFVLRMELVQEWCLGIDVDTLILVKNNECGDKPHKKLEWPKE